MIFRTNKSEFIPNAPAEVKFSFILSVLTRIANLSYVASSCFSVSLSMWDNSLPTWRVFVNLNTVNDWFNQSAKLKLQSATGILDERLRKFIVTSSCGKIKCKKHAWKVVYVYLYRNISVSTWWGNLRLPPCRLSRGLILSQVKIFYLVETTPVSRQRYSNAGYFGEEPLFFVFGEKLKTEHDVATRCPAADWRRVRRDWIIFKPPTGRHHVTRHPDHVMFADVCEILGVVVSGVQVNTFLRVVRRLNGYTCNM